MQKNTRFDENCNLLLDRFPHFAHLNLLLEKEIKLSSFLRKRRKSVSIQKWFSLVDIKKADIFFIYGIDAISSFNPIKKWLDEKKERAAVFLVDELINLASFLDSPSAKDALLHPGIHLFFIRKENLKIEINNIANRFPLGNINIETFPSYVGKNLFLEIDKYLFRRITLSNARFLDRFFSDYHFYNFLKNIKRLNNISQISKLKDAFANIPMIICGAGPSLEKNIHQLKKINSRALIMAGGSAISLLSAFGVPFHFSVAVDPNLEEYKRLKQANTFEMPFLFSLRLFSNVLACLNGPFGVMKSTVGELQDFLADDKLEVEGEYIGEKIDEESLSVTSMCLALADFFGCSPVIFCGMDLSYADGKRYVEKIHMDESTNEIGEKKKDDKDIFQNTVITTIKWQMETKAISSYIKKCDNIKFYNATNAGLGIDGAENISFEKLREKYFVKQYDFFSLIHSAMQSCRSSFSLDKKINKFFDECEKSFVLCIKYIKQILAEKPMSGKRALFEIELEEEMAYKYFFYDWKDIVSFSLKEKKESFLDIRYLLSMVKTYLKILRDIK